MITERLSGEIALDQEIGRALLVRRTLIVGMSEKNIASSSATKSIIKAKISQLEDDINQAMSEFRLRKELVSNIAVEALKDQQGPTAMSEHATE